MCHRCRLTIRELVVGFHGVAAAVAHMHCQGIVDHDLHTGNILLNLGGTALVKADLGNAVHKEVDGRPNWLENIM